jgi:polysaccharide export outer membrane protein
MPRVYLSLVLVAIAAAGGCSGSSSSLFGFRQNGPTPPPRELEKALLTAWIVEPGDGLLVQPVELDAPVRFAADQTVLPDGTIDLAQFGRPVVAGKSLPEIETDIQELVNAKAKEKVPVTVRLIARNSKVYYVLGEVNAPGSFPISGRETVLDAIVAAGGLTRRANEVKILLARPTPACGCRIVMPVCYPQIVQLGDTTTNYQLQPGDRVFIPSKGPLDDLFGSHKKETCGPCARPQTQCPAPPFTCPPCKE